MIKAPFIPSPREAIKRALELLCLREDDVFYDLGCGNGEVVVEAAKKGATAIGIEIDRYLAEVAREKIRENNLGDKAYIIEADFFLVDLSNATAIYSYLYRSINELLAPKFEKELRIGTRIVTLDFPIPGWIPIRVERFMDSMNRVRTLFLYIIGISNPSSLTREPRIYDYRRILRITKCIQ